VGVARPGKRYRIIRLNPTFSHINVCLAGSGRYLINGRWRDLSAGDAVLFPRQIPHGAQVTDDGSWQMAWIIFADHGSKFPRLFAPETRVARTDPLLWEWALSGLHRESLGANNPECLQAWSSVIHAQVQRLVRSDGRLSRLAAVWERVNADLAHPWTAAELAKLAGTSEVHLRRLCLRALHRTPLQQVAWLRTRHASFLLQATEHTVESVAWSVGYVSVSAFTTAFKRWHGRSPKG
jgi:AraC-like DNA-binding protein